MHRAVHNLVKDPVIMLFGDRDETLVRVGRGEDEAIGSPVVGQDDRSTWVEKGSSGFKSLDGSLGLGRFSRQERGVVPDSNTRKWPFAAY